MGTAITRIIKTGLPRSLVTAFIAFTMAGCGAGSAPLGVSYNLPTVPTTGITINSVNSQAVAQDTLSGSTGVMGAGPGGVSGIAVSGDNKQAVKLQLDKAIRIANKLLTDKYGSPSAATGVSQTEFCNGIDATEGTVTRTVQGNDERLDFSNCGDPAISVINGAMAATNVSYTGTPGSPPFTLSVTYTFDLIFTYNSGAQTVAMMGRFDIDVNAAGSLTITMSNGEMGLTSSGESVVISNILESRSCSAYNASTYVCTGSMTVSSNYAIGGTNSGGTVTVTTTTDLLINIAGGASFPHQGVIEVSGDNNSMLRITILDDDIGTNSSADDIEVFMDPDTTNGPAFGDEVTNYYTWLNIF